MKINMKSQQVKIFFIHLKFPVNIFHKSNPFFNVLIFYNVGCTILTFMSTFCSCVLLCACVCI